MQHLSDIIIAQQTKMKPIVEIAEKLGINADDLELYGKYKAKLPLSLRDDKKIEKSNLILVTAITPTPSGEGKTTISIGLNEGLNKIGKKAIAVIREPSLGPVFGIKGGAAGGGYSQVVPMEDINLHFTGDFSAIEKANNLLSALIDNNLQSKTKSLNIDPRSIDWKRVMDMNDRSLREMVIGLGGYANGVPRQEGFNITPASEVMAILCIAEDFEDLKTRLSDIFIGFTYDKKPIYSRDLKAENAMAILLKDAVKPNLVQTLEENPVIIHGGPFANIAQGTNSIIGTKMGMSLADFVITEAGFGADLGAEKFFDIKCVSGNLKPKAVVLVTTIRAMRHHGGASRDERRIPDVNKVQIGFANLKKHIENVKIFGITPIVAINKFQKDTQEEIDFVISACKEIGIKAVVAEGWEKGGDGMIDLAETVVSCVEKDQNKFTPLYDWNTPIVEKIETIAKKIYGADGVDYSKIAKTHLGIIKRLGLEHLPICMAKTQKSLSDNPIKIGHPKDFRVFVREFEVAAGADFVIPILGKMMRMPGLPQTPASENMYIDKDGKISGLS